MSKCRWEESKSIVAAEREQGFGKIQNNDSGTVLKANAAAKAAKIGVFFYFRGKAPKIKKHHPILFLRPLDHEFQNKAE